MLEPTPAELLEREQLMKLPGRLLPKGDAPMKRKLVFHCKACGAEKAGARTQCPCQREVKGLNERDPADGVVKASAVQSSLRVLREELATVSALYKQLKAAVDALEAIE